MRSGTWVTAVCMLALATSSKAQDGLSWRLNLKAGVNATPPNAQSLDYDLVNGNSSTLNKYLHQKPASYGVSLMAIAPKPLPWGGRLGAEIGVQQLFSSVFDPETAGSIPGIREDHQNDSEAELHLNLFTEIGSPASHLFFQLGGGLHEVRWTYKTVFHGTYVNKETSDGGYELSPGLFAAVGTALPLGSGLSLPLQLRVDAIGRYGVMIIPSIAFGFGLGK